MVIAVGLVLAVTPQVKVAISPMIPAEKFCTPLTIEAAKDPPGRVGREGMKDGLEPAEGLKLEAGRLTLPLRLAMA